MADIGKHGGKRISAALLAAILSLSLFACGTVKTENTSSADSSDNANNVESVNSTDSSESSESTDTVDTADTADTANTDSSSDSVYVTVGEKSFTAYSDYAQAIRAAIGQLTKYDGTPAVSSDGEWTLMTQDTESETNSFSRVLSSDGWLISAGNGTYYNDSEQLRKAVADFVSHENGGDGGDYDTADGEVIYSIECDEPSTVEEYEDAAANCISAWFTSLQSDDTEDYYRNTDFEIVRYEENSGKQKTNYIACGTVDGKKEFAVEVCYNATDCMDGSFYDLHSRTGNYTLAGTYWEGGYIFGRFRWADGKCTLISCYADTSDLNGIQAGEYANFYEFARRSDMDTAVSESFLDKRDTVVSKNLTITADGVPINLDIYCGTKDLTETDDTYTDTMFFRTYMNREMTYSTGVYFTDGETGKKIITYPKDFKLTFDNYDNDENPDYCIKYDEDEYGSYYAIEGIQTDGRVFNISGRAYEGGIYVAGCFDPSPRLQRTETMPWIGRGYDSDSGRYYPTDSSGNEIQLDDINMYSDRLYLPNDLKYYSSDENAVTCFMWNNTDSEITSDSTYSIEIYEMGEWKTVSENLSGVSVSAESGGYAEITYDISPIAKRYNARYRIVQKCGSLTGYGEFCLKGEELPSLLITADSAYDGSQCGTFGVTDYSTDGTEITSAVLTRDGKSQNTTVVGNSSSDSGEATDYTFMLTDGGTLSEGEYTLTVNGTAECKFTVGKLSEKVNSVSAVAKISDENVVITVTAGESACTVSSVEVYKKQNGDWQYTSYEWTGATEIKAGKTAEITVESFAKSFIEDESAVEEMYEYFKEAIAEDESLAEDYSAYGINIDKDTTYDEFAKALKDYYSLDETAEYKAVVGFTADGNSFETTVNF